jgi:hypothetical protein
MRQDKEIDLVRPLAAQERQCESTTLVVTLKLSPRVDDHREAVDLDQCTVTLPDLDK